MGRNNLSRDCCKAAFGSGPQVVVRGGAGQFELDSPNPSTSSGQALNPHPRRGEGKVLCIFGALQWELHAMLPRVFVSGPREATHIVGAGFETFLRGLRNAPPFFLNRVQDSSCAGARVPPTSRGNKDPLPLLKGKTLRLDRRKRGFTFRLVNCMRSIVCSSLRNGHTT